VAGSLSAVRRRPPARRQHPPDHAYDRGGKSYRTERPSSPRLGTIKKVTGQTGSGQAAGLRETSRFRPRRRAARDEPVPATPQSRRKRAGSGQAAGLRKTGRFRPRRRAAGNEPVSGHAAEPQETSWFRPRRRAAGNEPVPARWQGCGRRGGSGRAGRIWAGAEPAGGCGVRGAAGQALSRTGKATRPRARKDGRQRSSPGGTARRKAGKRSNAVRMAMSSSMRASGAATQ
jgi:hypothetical protein